MSFLLCFHFFLVHDPQTGCQIYANEQFEKEEGVKLKGSLQLFGPKDDPKEEEILFSLIRNHSLPGCLFTNVAVAKRRGNRVNLVPGNAYPFHAIRYDGEKHVCV